MPSLEIYSALDVRLPELSPRTGLYPLRPLGFGTPMIESLTSYITRLAQAHDVSTRALIAEYLRFYLPKVPVTDVGCNKRWGQHFLENAESLNGMTNRVEDWTSALEASTGVSNLRCSTMSIWKGIFSNRGVLRNTRAWCTSCYRNWHASGAIIYEPLLWALADVSVCPVHGCALAEDCPRCGRRSSVLTPRSRPGCCPHCHYWLGANDCDQPSKGLDPASEGAQVVASWMGALLARAPRLQQPPKDPMWANLRGCVGDLAEGNTALFARAAGLSTCIPVFWFTGRKLPSLSSLNRLCYRFRIPLFRFLTERIVPGDPDWENARRIIRRHEMEAPLSEDGHNRLLPLPDCRSADVSDREIKSALHRALGERPLPTIRQIAWRLGIDPHRIYERFPGFHETLRARRLDQLKAAAEAALLESPSPTLRAFTKRGFSRTDLRTCFPDLYRELRLHSLQRYYRKREKTMLELQAACVEEPPLSGRKLAARLGSERSHLKRIFPEIWDRILQRHAEYRKRELSRKRAAFVESVRRIATDLLIAGKYPSRRRILPLMTGTELRLEHRVVAEARCAVLAFHSNVEGECPGQFAPEPICQLELEA